MAKHNKKYPTESKVSTTSRTNRSGNKTKRVTTRTGYDRAIISKQNKKGVTKNKEVSAKKGERVAKRLKKRGAITSSRTNTSKITGPLKINESKKRPVKNARSKSRAVDIFSGTNTSIYEETGGRAPERGSNESRRRLRG